MSRESYCGGGVPDRAELVLAFTDGKCSDGRTRVIVTYNDLKAKEIMEEYPLL